MCHSKELVCTEEEKEDPPSTDTLVDDLSLSDDDDVGVGEGQGVGGERAGGGGGGGGVEEVPRIPSGGGATTRSAKSSSWEFLGSDLQKSMKRRRDESNEEVTRHLSERKRLRSIFDQRGNYGDMKNKQQMAAMESVGREGNKEERDFEREEKENRLVSDLSLSDSEDEIEDKCIEEDEKTDGNTES